jgi:hypothetical protein
VHGHGLAGASEAVLEQRRNEIGTTADGAFGREWVRRGRRRLSKIYPEGLGFAGLRTPKAEV